MATNNRAVMCYLPDELEAFVKGYCEANGLTATKGGKSEPRLGTGIVRIIKDFMERSYTASPESPESTRKSQAKVLDNGSLLARIEAIEGRLGVLEAFDLLSMLERLEAWKGSQDFAQRSELASLIGRLEGLEGAIANPPVSPKTIAAKDKGKKPSKYEDVCPNCQSEDSSRTGSYRTKQGKVARVTCNACSQEFRVLPDGSTAIVNGID